MLGTLKGFFSKKENPTDLESEFYDPDSNTSPNFLTNPKKINQLLEGIEESSPLCTISVEGVEEEFNSSILDIQLQNKQIILDELIPKHGNELLSNNKLKLSTTYKGIRLAFKLDNIKSGSSQGIAYYKASIPNRIYYPQRRQSPRIQLNSLNISFSGISSRTKTSVGGTIFDLSRTGIGILIPNNRARFQRGDLITDCRINLDDGHLNFELAVRFVKTPHSEFGKTQLGGHFENISTKHRHQLEHFVASIEREEIRNRKEHYSHLC
jgi:c-di-GMP-binding flagellar brake protein YcgR